METTKQKEQNSYKVLKSEFGYTNALAAPRLVKVVISVGTGSMIKKDKHKNDFVVDRLSRIAGQKPAVKSAKQSVASFKTRQGDPIGVSVTLRGARMYSFLDKLLNIALPRTKDFRGLNSKAIDNIGNLTIGIKEHSIFPETSDEELKDVFGLAITLVTTAKTKAEAAAFFDLLQVPFKK